MNLDREHSTTLEIELRELREILRVAQTVVSSLELDEVLENILENAMTLMEVPAGSVALCEAETGQMCLHAHRGLSETFTGRDRWRVKEGGLTQRILEEPGVFVVEDTARASFFNNPLAVEEGIRSLISVPLKCQQKNVGILYLNDFVPRSFPPQRLELLPLFGSFAAMSIDNARLHARAQKMACSDGLTGLFNHRHFKELFAKEMARARRVAKPLSLIMFDVDDFKLFNDNYGHPVGDKVLMTVAEILRSTLRESDLVARYGGEEFIVLLPGVDREEAVGVADRIRCEIAERATAGLGATIDRGITVSVGVAAYPRDGGRADFLLRVVDDLLYGAKQHGKNQVHFVRD